MSATSSRLRWALGIAVALHLLLGLWLFAGAHHRDLARAARRIALAEQALLPSTVQVAVAEAPLAKGATNEPKPFNSPAADADAEVARLQLAAAQAAALSSAAAIAPPVERLSALGAAQSPGPAQLASAQLRQPATARADRPGVVKALPRIAEMPVAKVASLEKALGNRLPRIQPKPVAKAPPAAAAAAPTMVAKAIAAPRQAPAASTANKKPPVKSAGSGSASTRPESAAAARSKDQVAKAEGKPSAQPRRRPSTAPLQAYSPPVPVGNSSFFAEREETYQLPSGKLSMRLANAPPRAAVAAPTGKGLPLETDAPLASAAAPSLLPPAPVQAARPEEPELPVRQASELPRLGALTAPVEKPSAPSLAAIEAPTEASTQDGAAPRVTIFEAPDVPETAVATQAPRAAAPANQRAAFFQEVTTQLKATNAQVLADSLFVSQKITVRMKFSIRRDGGLLRIAAAVKTPDWAVIEAAKVIRAAEPFPPMPPDLSGKSVELSFPVEIYAR